MQKPPWVINILYAENKFQNTFARQCSCLNWTANNLQHKALLLFHNDAHNHKITGILKQLKFRRSLRHGSVHVGTIIRESFSCLDKTTVMILYPRRSWRGQCHGSIPACCAGVRYSVEKRTVGATVGIFNCFNIPVILWLCVSLWNNKSALCWRLFAVQLRQLPWRANVFWNLFSAYRIFMTHGGFCIFWHASLIQPFIVTYDTMMCFFIPYYISCLF
jgi:hypothetical protein